MVSDYDKPKLKCPKCGTSNSYGGDPDTYPCSRCGFDGRLMVSDYDKGSEGAGQHASFAEGVPDQRVVASSELYDRGIEAAREEVRHLLKTAPAYSDQFTSRDHAAQLTDAAIEAFLSVQPTLQWCETHKASLTSGDTCAVYVGESMDYYNRGGPTPKESIGPCQIVEQRRVDGV